MILDEDDCRAVAEAGAARIDLDDQTVDSAGGVVRFEIDEEVKHRLLQRPRRHRDHAAERATRSTPSRPPGGADRGPVTTATAER